MSAQKYRKKPVEIEAWELPKWDEPNWLNDADEFVFSVTKYVDETIAIAEWCGGVSHMMCNPDEPAFIDATVMGPHISITTLEGTMAASPGDYIIRGVQGEFYPCKPDIFAATYDKVLDE